MIVNKPIMIIDGVSRPVTYQEWAQRTLSAKDYELFLAAQDRHRIIWETALTDGTVIVNDQTTGYIDLTINGIVSRDTEFVNFMQQMLSDPDVSWPGPGMPPVF